MRGHFYVFFKNRYVLTGLLTSLFLNFVIWALLLWRIKPVDQPIPLHHNVYFGIDLIGPWQMVFLMPGLGAFFLIFNFLLAGLLHLKDKSLSYFLVGGSGLLQIFLLAASVMVVLINIS